MMFVQCRIGLVQMIMLKNLRTFLLCLVAVAMTSATTQAFATTLYEEDFYASAGLAGYGWTADVGSGRTANVDVAPGSWAGAGWGIDGSTGGLGTEWWRKPLPAAPVGTTSITATANAYVRWSGGTSGDNSFGFQTPAGNWFAGFSYDNVQGWKLHAQNQLDILMFPGTAYAATASGADNTALTLTLDTVAGTLTGTVTGSAPSPYGGTATQTINLGGVDYSTMLNYHTTTSSGAAIGMDLDDILVVATGIPEPASLGLLGIAGSLMLLRRRRA